MKRRANGNYYSSHYCNESHSILQSSHLISPNHADSSPLIVLSSSRRFIFLLSMSDLLFGVSGLFSLHTNATYGRLKLVKSCLLLGRADVNGIYTQLGTTPLHAACYNGHLDVVKYLIQVWNANPTIQTTEDGWTPLHCAAMNGYIAIVKFLIEQVKVRPNIESNVRKRGRSTSEVEFINLL